MSAIEDYLHAHQRYRLDSPVPDDDEDAVDDFCSSRTRVSASTSPQPRRSSCERSACRPAGHWVRRRQPGGDRPGRGSDAHAWVQVHVGDGRWLWSDPTAGATLAEDRDGVATRLLDFLRSHTALLGALALGAAALATTTVLAVRRCGPGGRRPGVGGAAGGAGPRGLRGARAGAGRHPARPTAETSVLELRKSAARPVAGRLPDAERVSAALAVVQRVLSAGRPVVADEASGRSRPGAAHRAGGRGPGRGAGEGRRAEARDNLGATALRRPECRT